jgi:uncharacterized RDD family membrane protein YckC
MRAMHPQPPTEFNPYAPPTTDVDQGLQQNLDGYELADRGTRFAAWLIDLLLSIASVLPGLVLMFSMLGFADFEPYRFYRRMDEGPFILSILVMSLMALAFHIYQWYLISTSGQSLAKRWLGIMIVRMDGSPCGFVNGVLLRSWVMILVANIPVAGLILFYFVDPLMILGDERRCLHDHIASTRVVVAPRA